MIGWIIYGSKDAEKNKKYIEFYMEEGKLQNIEFHLILIENLEFGVKDNSWFVKYNKKSVIMPDFAVCRTIYPLLNKQLEYMGIKVFNNSRVAEICNDKAKTYQYVAQLGIPMVDSIFCRHDRIMDTLSQLDKPTVIKAVAGHGGNEVFLIKSQNGIEEGNLYENIYHKLNCSDVVVQPLTGNRHQDLRVYVIGNKIIAAILRTAKEGFKSNFSLGGKVEQYFLSKTENQLVNKIIDIFEFGMVGIDFIIGDEGELIFNEIEDVVGARMLYQCTDINLVKLYLEYIKSELY